MSLTDQINIYIAFATALGVLTSLYYSSKSLEALHKQKRFEYDFSKLRESENKIGSILLSLRNYEGEFKRLIIFCENTGTASGNVNAKEFINDLTNSLRNFNSLLESIHPETFGDSYQEIMKNFKDYKQKLGELLVLISKFVNSMGRLILVIDDRTYDSNNIKTFDKKGVSEKADGFNEISQKLINTLEETRNININEFRENILGS